MKISYNWLKSHLNLNIDIEEAAKILTDIGLEVEGAEKIEAVKGGLLGVVVGEVVTCGQHPDADKLKITTVNIGRDELLQIVCGAPNVAAGQKVMVATIGTTLYPTGSDEEFKIKRSKIRGVESLGMICAADELGIGTDHDGIMVLEPTAKVGTPAKELFKMEDDYTVEIGLTPNRIDAASHLGVARDLAAFMRSEGREAELIMESVAKFKTDKIDRPIEVIVENTISSPRYMGVTLRGVKVAASPEWLQKRLRAIGLKPHNNVVDITNFILHDLGQPLHAFDADKIVGNKILVKNCAEGTKFVTLDGIERTLNAEDLMICNTVAPMCIAGVFGGLESGVSEQTTSVFIESAYFNPVSTRKTAKRHGLSTDASFRYERGTDPNIPEYALKRCALLIKELAGGEIVSEVTDIYPNPIMPFNVEVVYKNVDRLIGKQIGVETMKRIVKALDIKVTAETAEGMSVEVPAYRVDVQREADVIEEILRIYGYNNVEISEHVNSTLSYAQNPDKERLFNMTADFLTANGFNEIMSNSLTKSSYYDNLTSYKPENCVKIINPLSQDLNVMRQTLLFNAMEAVQLNTNRRNSDMKFYEFGNCYYYDADKQELGGLKPYSEEYRLAMTVTGMDRAASWNVKSNTSDFFTLKNYAEKILHRFGLNIDEAVVETSKSDLYKEAVTYSFRNKQLFEIGIVSKKIKNIFDTKADVYFLEMNFSQLMHLTKNNKLTVKELSKYPEVRRDLALLVDKNITFSQLKSIAQKTERKLLKTINLFDVYEGDKLPIGKKSYAINFVLEDTTKTLNDTIIDKVMTELATQLEKQAGATIRK